MKEILQINNLNYQMYRDFNLIINKYNFVSIIGSNMCGKTTLLKVISGIIPTNNVVSCNNIVLNPSNVNKYIKQIGVVFPVKKESFLFQTVYEEMSYPLKNLGYSSFYINRQINKILNLFSIDIKDKKIIDLSLNEQQQLLFCISLLHNPKILLIDDIFSFMNLEIASKIIRILKQIKNLTIINFSANLNCLPDSDYVYVINAGKIELEGSANEIIKESKMLAKIGLEIPFAVNLSSKLQEEGIVDNNFYYLEDLVNELWK